mmetsp:Transcript_46703/g.129988  ORF Transcript_46703/g.129988 Transcript_46703/m.129988 type:complete len:380 (-) Transcript_46703:738-1877(-)
MRAHLRCIPAPTPPQLGQRSVRVLAWRLNRIEHDVGRIGILRKGGAQVPLEALRGLLRRSGVHQRAARGQKHEVAEEAESLVARLVDDADHGRALALRGLVEAPHDLVRRRAVKAAGGLVREEEQRLRHQLHRDRDPLALAARDAAHLGSPDACLHDGGQVQVPRDLLHSRLDFAAIRGRREPQTGLEADVVLHGQLPVEDIVLRDVPRHVPQESQVVCLLPVDEEPARDAAIEGLAAQDRQERGLAAARGAHHGDAVARGDAQVDSLQQLRAVRQREAHALEAEGHAVGARDLLALHLACQHPHTCAAAGAPLAEAHGSGTAGAGPSGAEDVPRQVHGGVNQRPGRTCGRRTGCHGFASRPEDFDGPQDDQVASPDNE